MEFTFQRHSHAFCFQKIMHWCSHGLGNQLEEPILREHIYLYIKATKLLLCSSFRKVLHWLHSISDTMTGCIFIFFSGSTFLYTSLACCTQVECHCKRVLFQIRTWVIKFCREFHTTEFECNENHLTAGIWWQYS